MKGTVGINESAERVPLGEVARLIRGVTFGPNDPVPLGIQRSLDEGDLLAVPASVIKRDEQYLRDGDILVSSANSWNLVGKCVPVPPGLPYRATAGGFISILRPEVSAIDADYLYRWLSADATQERVRGCSRQTTNIANLSVERFLGLRLPLPPLPEQRRIAALLDKADAIRRKRQQAIRLADDLLRSAFLDMFGNAVRAAHRWTPVPLATLCSAIVDCPHSTPAYAPSRTAYPCVRTSDLQDGFLDFSTTKYVDAGEYTARIGRMAPAAGDVLYSREGERFGIAAIVPPRITPCLGQRMMLLRADEAVARPAFLWALMNSPAFYSRVAQLAGGSTSPHVNVVDIKRLPAFLPPFPLQAQFERLVEQIAAIRNGIMDALPTADDLLHCLAQRAFRGDK